MFGFTLEPFKALQESSVAREWDGSCSGRKNKNHVHLAMPVEGAAREQIAHKRFERSNAGTAGQQGFDIAPNRMGANATF